MVSGHGLYPGKGCHLVCAVGIFQNGTESQLHEVHYDAETQSSTSDFGVEASS